MAFLQYSSVSLAMLFGSLIMDNHFSLKGKTFLVTGSTTGLGRAMANALGAAGARVAMNYQNNTERAESASVTAKPPTTSKVYFGRCFPL